jgi:hypothetical protein
MHGDARPIFYLVPITRELSEAATGQYPLAPTAVKGCVVASESNEGIENPDFRQSCSLSGTLLPLYSRRGALVGI